MESNAKPAPAQATVSEATPLTAFLRDRIRVNGPITFAEFMEACLYHPQHGYYTRGQRRIGDYYTSVEMHPIFGRLLARQLAEMWELLGRPIEFTAVECGAGNGQLAQHILEFAARALPEFYSALRYVAVERSDARRAAHAQLLAVQAQAGKCVSAAAIPAHIPAGCIFSNELLDAMPVHRVVQSSDGLKEVFVDWQRDAFCNHVAPLSTHLATYFAEQGISLPEGAQAEVCLGALDWIEAAGCALNRGFVLTIDYGHEARELYNQRHMRGTLLAYHRHRASEEFYARPGEQDLTAHVNFSALDLWGRKVGLQRVGLVSQSHFLMALGRANEFADLYDEGMSEAGRVRARLKLKSLIYPEGMGETFSVLIQQKGLAQCTTSTGLREP